jgi:hypothetical protein
LRCHATARGSMRASAVRFRRDESRRAHRLFFQAAYLRGGVSPRRHAHSSERLTISSAQRQAHVPGGLFGLDATKNQDGRPVACSDLFGVVATVMPAAPRNNRRQQCRGCQ